MFFAQKKDEISHGFLWLIKKIAEGKPPQAVVGVVVRQN